MANVLHPDKVRRIRELRTQGCSHKRIGNIVGCSPYTVQKYLKAGGGEEKDWNLERIDEEIDIYNDEHLAGALERAIRSGRPQEKVSAVIASLRLRAERSSSNPASEPMTPEEHAEFRRYLREEVYDDLCDECKESVTEGMDKRMVN